MGNEQFERFKELEKAHKKELKDVFDELTFLMKTCRHLFGKPTYKVEMTFPEWLAFEKRHLKEDA